MAQSTGGESVTDKLTIPLAGENAEGEIETLEEFLLEVEDASLPMNFDGWTFTDIDFTSAPFTAEDWRSNFNFRGAVFYGCTLPSHETVERMVKEGGARVVPQPSDVPFKVFRAFMYEQQELIANDAAMYKFYLDKNDLHSRLLQHTHDHFVQDALLDYLENKTVVAVMGGHQVRRADPMYEQIMTLSLALARKGFVVASGGGPGAMEAANLGAYMFEKSDKDVSEALKILRTERDDSVEKEYLDRKAPRAVIERFGWPTHQPSLAIPTWKYGHEPSNMFATWVCKMFSNALREDGLLEVANGGIVYTPGSAGTRQEIFQAACGNHYAAQGKEKPTIFLGTEFWTKSGIPQVLRASAEDRPYAKWISETDSSEEIIDTLVNFRSEYQLPHVTVQHLKSKHWISRRLQSKDLPHSSSTRDDSSSAPSAESTGKRKLQSNDTDARKRALRGRTQNRHKRRAHMRTAATDLNALDGQ